MRIGIVGGGQLAQLLGMRAYALGLTTLVYTDQQNCPAKRTNPLLLGSLEQEDNLRQFAWQCDVITFENENIPSQALAIMAEHAVIRPGQQALVTAQDRLLEKDLFKRLQLPTCECLPVATIAQLEQSLEEVTGPWILKTRRLGYDGKGQARITSPKQAASAWQSIGQKPALLEQQIDFKAEVSCLGARSKNGEIVIYPLITNQHKQGILRSSYLPSSYQHYQQQATKIVTTLLTELDYVGLLAVEFFVTESGLLVNEIAPRVHNSGHLTIEAINADQFENHLRAVSGLPLVAPSIVQPAVMLNILGCPPQSELSGQQAGMHYYNYGKQPRPGRKLGHITLYGEGSIKANCALIQSYTS